MNVEWILKFIVSTFFSLETNYPHMFWTPCVTHCISLMLKDIEKLPIVDDINSRYGGDVLHLFSWLGFELGEKEDGHKRAF